MNVSKHFAACSDGVLALQSEMGLTAKDMREGRRMSFAVVHADSSFIAELSAGDAIRLESSVNAIGTKSLTFLHTLVRCEDAVIAFETRFKCVLLDLKLRRATEIPPDIRDKAQDFMSDT
jgi:acyl-CoA thioester hydrolase